MLSSATLELWATAPNITEMKNIKETHELIRDSLSSNLDIAALSEKYSISKKEFPKIYLQGSYANSTNIEYASDVDIVIQLNNVFGSDKTQLSAIEKQKHAKDHSDSSYSADQFKKDVMEALRKSFGNSVELNNKCLKITGLVTGIDADIIPSLQYKLYKRYISHSNEVFVEGIKFIHETTGETIVNFPNEHLKNCKAKNVDSRGKFKDIVRIFKNIKRELISNGVIEPDLAPSYYVENLIYNCPSYCFDGSYEECVRKVLQHLFDTINDGRILGFSTANDQGALFKNNWNVSDATVFVSEAGDYFLNA